MSCIKYNLFGLIQERRKYYYQRDINLDQGIYLLRGKDIRAAWVNRIIACFYLFSGAVTSKGLQFIMHAAHLLAINAGICLSESLLEFVEVRIHEASSVSVL